MATKRDAVSTIRGYFYQFDYSIIKVLTLEKETDTICIEGIEDVDINDENNITLHQCKCYEGTEYSHSEIKKAVQWMLKHFAQNRDSCYKYYLYGVYKSGQDKLPKPLTVDFAKKYFFTTKHNNGSIDRLYDELSLNDDALSEFLNKLIININAESYSKQEQTVRETICSSLECRAQDVELYYCNALSIIKKLAAEKNPSDRTISRAEFIRQIRTVDDQFELWLLHKKGKDKFAKAIKKNFFSNGVNISPYNRFFIIECNKNTSIVDLKTIILLISKKYSKLTNHAKPKFCPYFCFYGLNEDKLIELKKSLSRDNVIFTDGYDFRGADFNADSVVKEPNKYHLIRLRIIDNLDLLDKVYRATNSTIEIYQFYNNKVYYENSNHKHVKIPFESINDITDMI